MLHLSGALRKEMGLKDRDVLPEAHEDGFFSGFLGRMSLCYSSGRVHYYTNYVK